MRLQNITGDEILRQLIRGGIGGAALKVSSTVLTLALTIVLARALGPQGYGIYAYALTLVNVIAIPAQLGLPPLVVRETAKAQAKSDWNLMRHVWRWSNRLALTFSLGLALLAAVAAYLGKNHFSHVELATFAFALITVPLISLGNLRDASLRGLRHIISGQLVEQLIRPSLTICALLVVLFIPSFTIEQSPATAMATTAFAALVSFFIGASILNKLKPAAVAKAGLSGSSSQAQWLKALLPLSLVAGLQLINQSTDVLMLGWLDGPDSVGIYAAATQLSMLTVFGLKVVDMAVAPYFARFHSLNELQRLQRIVTFSARCTFAIACPVTAFLILGSEQLLSLFYGTEFSSGDITLSILAAARLISAFIGSVGLLLLMTGNEAVVAKGVAASVVVNIALNIILIPSFGKEGAAIATATSIFIWNALLAISAWRLLKIKMTGLAPAAI